MWHVNSGRLSPMGRAPRSWPPEPHDMWTVAAWAPWEGHRGPVTCEQWPPERHGKGTAVMWTVAAWAPWEGHRGHVTCEQWPPERHGKGTTVIWFVNSGRLSAMGRAPRSCEQWPPEYHGKGTAVMWHGKGTAVWTVAAWVPWEGHHSLLIITSLFTPITVPTNNPN